MKKIFLLFIIIISSCSSKVKKKDIQGTWYWEYKKNDNNNLSEVIINNDSIILVDYLNFIKKGSYIIKEDSIIINLKNEILRKKVKINDTSLLFNSTSFRKSFEYEIESLNLKENRLINLESVRKITTENLSKYEGNFLLSKENDSIKILFRNKEVSLEEYIYSIPNHPEIYGHVAFLGNDFSLMELKETFLEMNYNNIQAIRLVTKTNFTNFNYDVYFVRTDVWQIEIDKYIQDNRLEKREFPNLPEAYSREKFISLNKPFLLKIKSKKDFYKLENLVINSTYLISINIELSVKDYLILWQKINTIRKRKKLKIRTEIIEFPQHQ